MKKLLKIKNVLSSYILDNHELNKIVSNDISKGKVVGWFQGKMEWGPRALRQ